MKTLVTGATGHVGANLVRELLAEGRDVRVMIHHDTHHSLDGLAVERVFGNVSEPDSLDAAMKGVDTAIHLVALISIDGSHGGLVEKINIEGARNVAEAALRAGVKKYVHVSSVHAFDHKPVDVPLDENRKRVGPGHPAYDRSKNAGELEVKAVIKAGLPGVIVNPSGIIGPNDFSPSRMGQFFVMLHKRTLVGLVTGGFDWVDVRDVVRGILAAEKQGRVGENYLLGGHWVEMDGLAKLCEEITGVPKPKFVFPRWLAMIGAPFSLMFARLFKKEPLYTMESISTLDSNRHVDTAKAERELGYSKRPIEETIRDVYAFFETEKML